MELVGVGIEPTFRDLQTRANPSQLSDRVEVREKTPPGQFGDFGFGGVSKNFLELAVIGYSYSC